MRLYFEVARRAFARYLTYRAALLAGLGTNAFFGILLTYVFKALYAGREIEGGWTEQQAITYVWVAQSLIMPLFLFAWNELALTIRSGDVVSDLSKPFDFYTFWLAKDVGRALIHVLTRMLPTLAIGWLLFRIDLLTNPIQILLFATSLVLAVWTSFSLRFIFNSFAFWVLDHRGPLTALMFISNFFSGFIVPLNYWPEAARVIASWLPFAATVQIPVSVYLGTFKGQELALAFLMQAAWGLALMGACQWLTGRAERRVVVQGG